MNLTDLTKLQQQAAELESVVRDDLAKYSDDELLKILLGHLQLPVLVVATAMQSPDRLVAMAAVTIQRERIRRAEVGVMEDTC